MLKVKPGKDGLKLEEPQVIGKINGKTETSPQPLSEVIAFYSQWISDFDQLQSLGWQDYVVTMPDGAQNTITFVIV